MVVASAVPAAAAVVLAKVTPYWVATNSALAMPPMLVTDVAAVPVVAFTPVKPEINVASTVKRPELLLTTDKVSMPVELMVAADTAAPPEATNNNVSEPAPPTKLSPVVSVVDVELVSTDVNVSSPAPPVNLEPVSRPVVKVNVALLTVVAAAANVPPVLPVVCDKVKEASTFELKAVAAVP